MAIIDPVTWLEMTPEQQLQQHIAGWADDFSIMELANQLWLDLPWMIDQATPPAEPTTATAENPMADLDQGEAPEFLDLTWLSMRELQDQLTDIQASANFGNADEHAVAQAWRIRNEIADRAAQPQTPDITPEQEAQQQAVRDMQNQLEDLIRAQDQQRREEERRLEDQLFDIGSAERAQIQRSSRAREKALKRKLAFAWVGESTFAVEALDGIQRDLDWALQKLAQSQDARRQLGQARINKLGQDRRDELAQDIKDLEESHKSFVKNAIDQANKLNKEVWALAKDSINNLLDVVEKSWALTSGEITLDDMKLAEGFAANALDENGNLNEDVMAGVPANLHGLVTAMAAKIQDPTGEAAATVTVWTGKNQRRFQWDPDAINSAGGKGAYSIEIGARGGGDWGWDWGGWGWGDGDPFDLDFSKAKFKNVSQWQAFGFAARIANTMRIFDGLEKDITGFSTAWIVARRAAPNFAKGDIVRQQEQAERNFVNAVLRRESGAAINEDEFDSARMQYLPQPGDDPVTLAQKRKNRMSVLNSMAAESANLSIFQPAINILKSLPPTDETEEEEEDRSELDDIWDDLDS